MLPRVATTTGTVQPTPAIEARASAEAAVRPQLSAAALANLKAEVLLRLLETMLKHMPRMAEPNPRRDLLETLLAALKTLPGREGEKAGKLADIIAKLPPALRPNVEKLITTVLSAMPTRSLVEIVRNPNGPEAQKLAHFLATSLDLPDAGAERQQKPVGLTAQQLATVGRHGTQQGTAQAAQVLGDARVLQTALKRIFDLDGSSKPRPLPGRASEVSANQQAGTVTNRPAGEAQAAARSEARQPAARAGTGQHAVQASEAAIRHHGAAEDSAPAVRREAQPAKALAANDPQPRAYAVSAGNGVAEDSAPAAKREALPAKVLTANDQQSRAHAASTGNGAAEDSAPAAKREALPAKVLTANDQQSRVHAASTGEQRPAEAHEAVIHPKDDIAAVRHDAQPARTQIANAAGQALARSVLQAVARDLPPALLAQAVAQLVENLSPEEANFLRALLERPLDPAIERELALIARAPMDETAEAIPGEATAKNRAAQPETTTQSPPPPPLAAARETPAPVAREAAQAAVLADGLPDGLPPASVLREGVPLAFVPYLPAEEDVEWQEAREAEREEAADEETESGENEDGADTDAHAEADADEPGAETESADMTRRREKTAEMVGVLEPGLVFYQKLGDYWT